jgi:hypothetical protein
MMSAACALAASAMAAAAISNRVLIIISFPLSS